MKEESREWDLYPFKEDTKELMLWFTLKMFPKRPMCLEGVQIMEMLWLHVLL